MENKITFTSWEIIKMAGQSLLFGITIPIIIPLSLIFFFLRYLFRHSYALLRGMQYDDGREEYISREEYKEDKKRERIEKRKDKIKKKIEKGIVKTTDVPHKPKHPFTDFLCVDDDSEKIPVDAVAYIENEPDEKIREFFRNESEYIRQLSQKYGIDFTCMDAAKLKSKMIFPQDIKEMCHGIIWHSSTLTGESEYGLWGRKCLYFELNAKDDDSIKSQLENAMNTIYENIFHL